MNISDSQMINCYESVLDQWESHRVEFCGRSKLPVVATGLVATETARWGVLASRTRKHADVHTDSLLTYPPS